MVLFLPSRRSFLRPQGPAMLAPGHPLNVGVWESWLFPDLRGLGPQRNTLSVTGTINPGASTQGLVRRWGAGGGGNYYLDLGGTVPSLGNEVSMAFVLKRLVNTPGSTGETGLAAYYPSISSTHYPYTDGSIYIGLLRQDRQTLGAIGLDRSKWHHLLISSSVAGNFWRVYQNGVLIYSTTVSAWTPGYFRIGSAAPGNSYSFEGDIAAVTVWGRPLSPAEAAAAGDPAHWWDYLWRPSGRLYVSVAAGGTTQTLLPAAISTAESVSQPTVAPGVRTLLAEGIASAEALGQPSLSLQLKPQGIASAEAVGEPTLVPGVRTLLPAGIASGESVSQPTLIPGAVSLLPAAIASAEGVAEPTLSLGLITVLAEAIASTEALGQPTLVPGTRTLLAEAVGSAELVSEPTVGALVLVLPVGVASAQGLGQPTLIPGTRTLLAAGVVSAESLGQPTLAPGVRTLLAESAAFAAAVGAPTVVRGALTLLPAGIATLEALGNPILVPGVRTLLAEAIVSAEALGHPYLSDALTQVLLAEGITPPWQLGPLGNGLLAWWSFDEASGIREDLTGRGNDLYPVGGAIGVSGLQALALRGDTASGQYASRPTRADLELGRGVGSWSLGAWAQLRVGGNGYGFVFSHGVGGATNYLLLLSGPADEESPGFIYADIAGPGTVGFVQDLAIVLGKWYAITLSFNDATPGGGLGTYRLRIRAADGSLDATDGAVGTPLVYQEDDANELDMAGRSDDGGEDILLDDSGIWDHALSETEEDLFFNGGLGVGRAIFSDYGVGEPDLSSYLVVRPLGVASAEAMGLPRLSRLRLGLARYAFRTGAWARGFRTGPWARSFRSGRP